jgi:hypothetical protein
VIDNDLGDVLDMMVRKGFDGLESRSNHRKEAAREISL